MSSIPHRDPTALLADLDFVCGLGAVAIDSVLAAGTARLRPGQRIDFASEHVALMLRLGLPVAYADDAVVVVHKPPGLAVRKGPLVDHSIADVLARELPGAGLAHRLDRDASGLLLIGRNPATLRELGAAMERGDITRQYDAIVCGVLTDDTRTIDLPLTVTDEPRGDRPKTGPPDVTNHGDSANAWTPGQADRGQEWLRLTFAKPSKATEVRIRQSFHPGAVTKVEFAGGAREKPVVFAGSDPNVDAPNTVGWFTVQFPATNFVVTTVTIVLDTAKVPDWNQLDAVQLVGTSGNAR